MVGEAAAEDVDGDVVVDEVEDEVNVEVVLDVDGVELEDEEEVLVLAIAPTRATKGVLVELTVEEEDEDTATSATVHKEIW